MQNRKPIPDLAIVVNSRDKTVEVKQVKGCAKSMAQCRQPRCLQVLKLAHEGGMVLLPACLKYTQPIDSVRTHCTANSHAAGSRRGGLKSQCGVNSHKTKIVAHPHAHLLCYYKEKQWVMFTDEWESLVQTDDCHCWTIVKAFVIF